MSLKREVNYEIPALGPGPGYAVRVESEPSRARLTICQKGEGDMEVVVYFHQLGDLIEALEEILKGNTDSGRWDR